MSVHVLALQVDLHVGDSRSLKAKRSVVRSVLDTARRRYSVAAAETGHQDVWQRAQLAFVAVAGSSGHCTDVIDQVERYLWSVPEAEVLGTDRHWLEIDS